MTDPRERHHKFLLKLPVRWSGWCLVERTVVEPRKVLLTPVEARVLLTLMAHRNEVGYAGKADKVKQNEYLEPAELARRCELSVDSLRTAVATLRHGIGKNAVKTSRERGYKLQPANHTTDQPIDALIDKLEDCLAEAKRIKKTAVEA